MAVADYLFGWAFKPKEAAPEPISFSPKQTDDGAVVVAAAGAFGTYIDLDGTVRSDAELITRYREMSIHPEVDAAIDEIINEMIAGDEEDTVKIILDDLDQNQTVKKAIEDAFKEVMQLLDFRHHSYDIIRRWYIDGRQYLHVIIDEKDPRAGIRELRYIDPRKIRKIREVVKKRVRGTDIMSGAATVLTQVKNEYYLYNDRGFMAYGSNPGVTGPSTGLKIAKDAIVYVTSGLTDSLGARVLSYLHKAIKPLNQLRTLEDASVIYRLSRSPERRIWHIDVGNLPKLKAEQYVRDIMAKHKNRLTYDATTGEIRDDRKFQTILEDYWLPNRDGKGTEVTVLPPGTSFNQIDDILYFLKKLYMSLHVPVDRLDPDNQYNEAVATGITRDEIKFGKLIQRLRLRFSQLFIKLLEKQIVLKGIMTLEDWERIAPYIRFDYVKNNYFIEAKDREILTGRMTLLQLVAPFVGRYYSDEWVRKNILKQTDEEIEEIDEQIAIEATNPQYEGAPGMPPEAGPEDAGVMMDADQAEIPPPGMEPPPKANTSSSSTKSKPGSSKKTFKSVASALSKKT